MDDGFGVGPGPIAVPLRFELGTEVCMVVDFAVEGHPYARSLVRHRLMPAGDVHDAETAMGECGVLIGVEARVVRTTVRHHVADSLRPAAIVGVQMVGGHNSCDSAHATEREQAGCHP